MELVTLVTEVVEKLLKFIGAKLVIGVVSIGLSVADHTCGLAPVRRVQMAGPRQGGWRRERRAAQPWHPWLSMLMILRSWLPWSPIGGSIGLIWSHLSLDAAAGRKEPRSVSAPGELGSVLPAFGFELEVTGDEWPAEGGHPTRDVGVSALLTEPLGR